MTSAAREQARRMAARGVSASEIRQRTGLSGAGSRNVVSNWSPAGQASHQAAAVAAAAGSPGGSFGARSGGGNSSSGGSNSSASPTAPVFRNSAGDIVRTQASPESTAAAQKQLADLKAIHGDRVNYQFIPGLLSPGMKGYNSETGGGNWVFAQGNIDPEQLRAWYRGDPNNGTDLALVGKNRDDFTLEGLYGRYSASPQESYSASSYGGKQKISKKNSVAKNLSIASGLNNVLSNSELLKIARTTKMDPEKVLEKGVGRGMLLGSSVVNKYQKGAYTDPRLSMTRMALPGFAMAAGKDSAILQQLRNAGKQDTGSALFIGSKGSTATTLPRKIGIGNAQQPIPATPANTESPVSSATQPTVETPITSITPQTLPEKIDPGPGMMSGGGMGAAGANKLNRAKSRLRKLGINGRGTGLFSRGLQYGNALNK